MGPKKKLLALINLINQEKNIVGTYIVDSDRFLIKKTSDNTINIPTNDQDISRPSTSSDNSSSFTDAKPTPTSSNFSSRAVSSSTFSRYETVEKTLLNHPQGKEILKSIRGSASEEDRRCLVRIIVGELVKTHGDSCYPPKEAKIALAKAVITEFSRLRDNKQPRGYEHYYNPGSRNDRGFIENRLLTMRKRLPPAEKKYNIVKSNKQKPVDLVQTSDLTDEEIGRMINLEFDALFPKSKDQFLGKFPSFYAPRILAYVKKYRPALHRTSEIIDDRKINLIQTFKLLICLIENFRALLLLIELLPVSNARKTFKGKGKCKEKKRKIEEDNIEDEKENRPKIEFPNKFLLKQVPEGTDLKNYVKAICKESILSHKSSVQPYLIVVSGQSTESTFIQGDGWFIDVNDSGNRVASFDLLFKFFYVLNIEYPESLRNFYNFIESYVYEMNVKPYNIVSSVHINISNFNPNEDA
ncbi:unnamed protein product [Brassicogethes aeneus]|uniref:Uncharacterized protein n=1 Tax=Brassicogethes aeneus TaxID=1431903 RepID=A0A9P0ASI5_BRAAE|nr:unnamed protein product [Brassicogethes aeneus]